MNNMLYDGQIVKILDIDFRVEVYRNPINCLTTYTLINQRINLEYQFTIDTQGKTFDQIECETQNHILVIMDKVMSIKDTLMYITPPLGIDLEKPIISYREFKNMFYKIDNSAYAYVSVSEPEPNNNQALLQAFENSTSDEEFTLFD